MAGALELAWRDERARLVGALARRFGDLGLAEDAVQEAFERAHRRWPIDGEPERPGAWLRTVAVRQAIGALRARRDPAPLDEETLEAPDEASAVDDDLLGLLLACCHPALDPAARVALTLRHVCGLSADEIAAAFVVAPDAMAKRLVRARSKLRDAGIPFTTPRPEVVESRLDELHDVVYAVFTEGHLSSSGEGGAVRVDLCEEAIWLARQLAALLPADDESRGLLALLLLHHARRGARVGGDGSLVRLEDQERARWDASAIEEGRRLLAEPGTTTLGRFRVEAAIAALHVAEGGPDWARLADLHELLARLAPSPVVEVNRAVAVGRADGPPAGLAVLQRALADGALDRYAMAHVAHAELLGGVGRPDEAAVAWERAVAAATNPTQRVAILARRDATTT